MFYVYRIFADKADTFLASYITLALAADSIGLGVDTLLHHPINPVNGRDCVSWIGYAPLSTYRIVLA